MTQPVLPLAYDPRRADAEHLRLLHIFHYIMAGLSLVGVGLLALHGMFMFFVFSNAGGRPMTPTTAPAFAGPPREFFWFLGAFYAVLAVLILTTGVLNFLSGRFMKRRRHRMFSLVVAGIDCLQFPLGTALGVFTFIVLMRESVRQEYEQHAG